MTPEQLREVGFSDAEVKQFADLQTAGFTEDEIINHFTSTKNTKETKVKDPKTGGFKYVPAELPPQPEGAGYWKPKLSATEVKAADETYQQNLKLPTKPRQPGEGTTVDYPEGGVYPGFTKGQENFRAFTGGIPPALGTLGAYIGGMLAGVPGGIEGEGLWYAAGKQIERKLNPIFGGKEPPPSPGGLADKHPMLNELSNAAWDTAEGTAVALTGAGMNAATASAGKSPYFQALKSDFHRMYNTAIKPVKAGLPEAKERVERAFAAIVKNSKSLNLSDDLGLPSESPLPENRAQHLEAILQTMGKEFAGYDTLQKEATGQGVTIPTEPFKNMLKNLEKRPGQTYDKRGLAQSKLIQKRMQEIEAFGAELSPQEAQNILTRWNNFLQGHQKNPSTLFMGEAEVMATEARAMREAVEKAMESSGPEWAERRKNYGALRSILDDARKAAVKRANTQQGKFNIDIFDIYASSLIMGSLAGGNPAGIAKAVDVQVMKRIGQWLKGSDRNLKNAYKNAAKLFGEGPSNAEGRDLFGMGAAPRPKPEVNPDAIPMGTPERLMLPPPNPNNRWMGQDTTAPGFAMQMGQKVQPEAGTENLPQFVRSHQPYVDTKNLIEQRVGLQNRGNLGRTPPQALKDLSPTPQTSVQEDAVGPIMYKKNVPVRNLPQGTAAERAEAFMPGQTNPRTLGKTGKVTVSKDLPTEERLSPAGKSAQVFEAEFEKRKGAVSGDSLKKYLKQREGVASFVPTSPASIPPAVREGFGPKLVESAMKKFTSGEGRLTARETEFINKYSRWTKQLMTQLERGGK